MGDGQSTMDIQDKKAYQKQPHMTSVKCRKLSRTSRKGARYVKDVGLGYKTPKTAIEGKYIDKKCPFTGNVSILGKILKGVVKSAGKMTNPIQSVGITSTTSQSTTGTRSATRWSAPIAPLLLMHASVMRQSSAIAGPSQRLSSSTLFSLTSSPLAP